MLDEEVIEAVRAGTFFVHPVETVEQGIELLTGMPAGERDATGRFAGGTLFALVDARLRELAEAIVRFGPPGPGGD